MCIHCLGGVPFVSQMPLKRCSLAAGLSLSCMPLAVILMSVFCMCVQQTDTSSSNSSSNGTLPGVLPGERLVVTSTGLQTNGTSAVNVTGESAYDRISSIESGAMGTDLTNPYQRLIR